MSKFSKFFSVLKFLAPVVLPMVNPKLAQLTPVIVHGMDAAEALYGEKNGAKKLAYVKDLARTSAVALNTAKGEEVINLTDLDEAVTCAVDTTVKVVNMVKDAKQEETGKE